MDIRLTTELAFGADLARDARHFRGKGAKLIDHRVDGVFQLQNLALDVDGDLLGQITPSHRRGDLGDVAHLCREVRRHPVDTVGQLLPDASDALDIRLAAKLSLSADLARNPRDFRGERAQLVNHRVYGFLEFEDLAID